MTHFDSTVLFISDTVCYILINRSSWSSNDARILSCRLFTVYNRKRFLFQRQTKCLHARYDWRASTFFLTTASALIPPPLKCLVVFPVLWAHRQNSCTAGEDSLTCVPCFSESVRVSTPQPNLAQVETFLGNAGGRGFFCRFAGTGQMSAHAPQATGKRGSYSGRTSAIVLSSVVFTCVCVCQCVWISVRQAWELC